MAGSAPCGEDFEVAFVNPAEDGMEGFKGCFTRAQSERDGGGGSCAVAVGGALVAFTGDEVEDVEWKRSEEWANDERVAVLF